MTHGGVHIAGVEGFAISGLVTSRVVDASHTPWGNPAIGPEDEGRLPCRSTNDRRPPVYVEAHQRNLLRRMVELPYDVLLFEAEQVIRMHEPTEHIEIVYDKQAMWRGLVKRSEDEAGTVYARQRCKSCANDGCALLDAAKLFAANIGPYEQAEHPSTTREV